MTLDDPRREPHPDSPPRSPEPEIGMRPDGYLVEPPLADPARGEEFRPRHRWSADDGDSSEVRPELDADDDDKDEDDRQPVTLVIRDRRRHLGIVAFCLAVLLFGANVVGIVLSNSGSDDAALSIAYVTIFGTIVTFAGGLLAAVLDLGRGWGVAAVVLSVLANPFVLVVLLGSFTGALG